MKQIDQKNRATKNRRAYNLLHTVWWPSQAEVVVWVLESRSRFHNQHHRCQHVTQWLSALKKIWTKYHLLCATMISEFDCLTTIRTPIRCFVPKDNEPIAHLIQRTMSHLFRSLHEKELPTKSAKYCSCPIRGAHCFKALPQFQKCIPQQHCWVIYSVIAISSMRLLDILWRLKTSTEKKLQVGRSVHSSCPITSTRPSPPPPLAMSYAPPPS